MYFVKTKALFLMIFCLLSISPQAYCDDSDPNAIPIEVGGTTREMNIPFVSVTICVPGTSQCQTIDHIELDTGSTGLRLFSSVLNLTLPPETTASGYAVAECMSFGGGTSWWGPIVNADVILGDETASSVPIQIFDNQFQSKPSSCNAPFSLPSQWGSNGILGISPAQTDCFGSGCPSSGGQPYYTCDDTSCSPATLSPDQQTQNPVALLPSDNNGVVIDFPAMPQGGNTSSSGTLYLGLGTRANNTPPDGLTALGTTYDGWFKAALNGNTYWSKMDTGTASWSMPSDSGGSFCEASGATEHYLCPNSPLSISLTLEDIDQAVSEPFSFQMGNAEAELSQGYYASSDIGQNWGEGISNAMILGMPFFYGKTVYFGYGGSSSSLGAGPLNAFQAN